MLGEARRLATVRRRCRPEWSCLGAGACQARLRGEGRQLGIPREVRRKREGGQPPLDALEDLDEPAKRHPSLTAPVEVVEDDDQLAVLLPRVRELTAVVDLRDRDVLVHRQEDREREPEPVAIGHPATSADDDGPPATRDRRSSTHASAATGRPAVRATRLIPGG